MLGGELYLAADPELRALHTRCKGLLFELNGMHPDKREARTARLGELFGSIGRGSYFEMPFYCDYGINIHIGSDTYANANCVFLDVGEIRIGNGVMFAPAVHLYTATHPIDPVVRSTYLEYALPITIEDDVWIGGLTVVNPGVTIGKGSVIGSGSVVTKDIPPMVIAAGNPCRIIRPITDEDAAYWARQHDAYIAEMGPLPW